jgi:hypothetical protein
MKHFLLSVAAAFSCITSRTDAQRPAPPRDWTIDSTDRTVVATRKGGVLSTPADGRLLGPYTRASGDPVAWLDDLSAVDAATVGRIQPRSGNNEIRRDEKMDGYRVLTRVVEVRIPAGTVRFLAYRLLLPSDTTAALWLQRLLYADGLTLMRTMNAGFAALTPYAVRPPAALAALTPAPPPISLPEQVAPRDAGISGSTDGTRADAEPVAAPSSRGLRMPFNDDGRFEQLLGIARADARRAAATSPVPRRTGAAPPPPR